MDTNNDTDIDTVIIGAGQAGLVTGHFLRQRGIPFVILDASTRVGDNWRRQWDSLRLYSPAHVDGLPGLPFPAPRWTFPGKDAVGDYLESYARTFALPVRLETRVQALDQDDEGYVVTTDRGRYTCRNVVVCTGTFGRTSAVPDITAELDPAILQLHSSEYRRPSQVNDGPVLVVGASHSGTDIAYELAETHPTILAGRDCGEIPPRLESPAFRLVFPVMLFAWRHVLTRRTPVGRKEMAQVRHHGGPMIRVKRRDLLDRGVERVTSRVEEVRDGLPVVDGTPREVSTVVWATGFRQVFDWIHLPVIGDDGWPRETRGVSPDAPGLFFCGLSFQYSFSSMVLPGVGRDAAYVADRVADRARKRDEATPTLPTAA
ncbi:flavin-containing monooxygenase [Nocardioides ganghwensis]|jgi:putative flavoprotein involved in K+ transport|uniref:Portal protein n=1 Tax=Nocardioides ganghwensis TaxID=252230 RepID=A0A4Q2SEK7_9ACTN|nr:NAD(P)/FAD-dependent oxidoreductase [Nocardioides ganghwensis]MBD3944059.1 NAD(P)-binding domain-containing protein [Nocardioides ganghwensis]RYC01512.1 portal protein [Nocardioides ganghwensis]